MAESERRRRERTAAITLALERARGEPRWAGPTDPLDSLVLTLLSQSTSDGNRDLAYGRLRERFQSWREVMEAPQEAVAEAIRSAGLGNQKSGRLIAMLRWVEEQFGELNLDALREMPTDEAFERLTAVKGVGVKTVAVVLMFACGRDVFPVDTHVHRICHRLGLVPESADAVKTFQLMVPLVPSGKAYSLHMNLIGHGRTVCTARSPDCAACPIHDLCRRPQKSKRE